MELNKLRALLKKYDLGETTLQEEQQLKGYFKNNEVSQEFEVYKKIFTFTHDSKKMEYSKNVTLPSRSNKRWAYTGIAASVLIVLSFMFFNDLADSKLEEQNLGTIEDPEKAFLKTKETLDMVAGIFSESKQDLEYLKEFNKTKNKFIEEQ